MNSMDYGLILPEERHKTQLITKTWLQTNMRHEAATPTRKHPSEGRCPSAVLNSNLKTDRHNGFPVTAYQVKLQTRFMQHYSGNSTLTVFTPEVFTRKNWSLELLWSVGFHLVVIALLRCYISYILSICKVSNIPETVSNHSALTRVRIFKCCFIPNGMEQHQLHSNWIGLVGKIAAE